MKTSCFRFALCVCAALCSGISSLSAQPWSCDFGLTPGSFTSGASNNFLPPLTSGNTRVRIGTQGGAVELRNPGDTRLGSGCEVALTAPTGASLNKLQWFDFTGSSGFTLQTSMLVTGGPGDLYFFCGNGSCFSDNLGFSSSQVFTGLKWSRDSSGISLFIRGGGSWTQMPTAPVHVDSVLLLELYANNSATGITYVHGSSQSLAPLTYDLWIDGSLVVNDHAGAGLPDSIDIDSFMFYASGSPSNAFTLLLDDLRFTNSISVQPLPVELTAFEARSRDGLVQLRWKTESEIQNFGFEIQRSDGGDAWEARGFVPGDGDRHTPRWYEFTDTAMGESCLLRYRLRQIDRDGSATFSPVRSVGLTPAEGLIIGAPWPQPARGWLTVPLLSETECTVSIELLSLAGTQVAVLPAVRLLPACRQDLRLPCDSAGSGAHFLIVRSGADITRRLVLLI